MNSVIKSDEYCNSDSDKERIRSSIKKLRASRRSKKYRDMKKQKILNIESKNIEINNEVIKRDFIK